MPGGNRMGPTGMGPMTGRGLGFCSGGDESILSAESGFGGFNGSCRWSGQRRRNRFRTSLTNTGNWQYSAEPVNEIEVLAKRAEILKTEIESINQRLSELVTEKDA